MSVYAIVSCQADKIRTVGNRSKSPGVLGKISVSRMQNLPLALFLPTRAKGKAEFS